MLWMNSDGDLAWQMWNACEKATATRCVEICLNALDKKRCAILILPEQAWEEALDRCADLIETEFKLK